MLTPMIKTLFRGAIAGGLAGGVLMAMLYAHLLGPFGELFAMPFLLIMAIVSPVPTEPSHDLVPLPHFAPYAEAVANAVLIIICAGVGCVVAALRFVAKRARQ